MAESSIIREFLVALGFSIDEAGFKKFDDALKRTDSGTAKSGKGILKFAEGIGKAFGKGAGGPLALAVAFGDILAKTAEWVVKSVLKMAEVLDQLYFTSRRVNSAAENIQAFSFAMTQLGGSAGDAQSALEGVAYFLASTAGGGERFIQGLGVATRNMNGSLRDTSDIIADLGKHWAAMAATGERGQAVAIRQAELLGINYKALLALENPQFGAEADKYKDFAKALGLGDDGGVDAANKFAGKLRDIKAETNLVIIAIGGKLLPILQQFADFLSRLPGYVEDFRRSDLGGELIEIAQALGPVLKDLLQIAEVIAKHVIPQVNQLSGVALKQLVDELHFVRDALKLVDDLLHGDFTKAWVDVQKVVMDATRAMAHAIEGVLLLMMKLNPFSNMDAQAKTKRQIDSLIDQYLPDGATPGGAAAGGAAQPKTNAEIMKEKNAEGTAEIAELGRIGGKGPKLADDGSGTPENFLMMHGWTAEQAKALAARVKARIIAAYNDAVNQIDAPSLGDPGTNLQGPSGAPEDIPGVPAGAKSKSVRNNNPGNLTDPRTGQFQHFGSWAEGTAAMKRQLLRDFTVHGLRTVADLINNPTWGWSPERGRGNSRESTMNYIASVSKSLGVSANQAVNFSDPAVLNRLVSAMSAVEGGWGNQGKLMGAASAASTVNISQKVEIHVQGVSGDPHAVGTQVAKSVNRASSDLVRNLKTVVA
jgi:hypothetical protein